MTSDFSEHRCTFLLYPSRSDVWRENAMPARESVCSLCNLISSFEKVYLGTDTPISETLFPSVTVIDMEYNDIWIRDSGPVPIEGGAVAFRFNAWGGEDGLYSDWSKDSNVSGQIGQLLNIPVYDSFITLEGGNLVGDGDGTLIAVKGSLINSNRNPGLRQETIEKELKNRLGVTKLIWLERGLKYDETGGHVDNVCAFADIGKVFLAWTEDKHNPQYEVVHEIYEKLSGECDARGRKFEIIKIPLPDIFYRSEKDCAGIMLKGGSKARMVGEPMQASYINFIFVNGGVIVPQFGDRQDKIVLEIFKKHFQKLKIATFNAREIVLGGGGLHCITKNL